MGNIWPYKGMLPKIAGSAFVAPDATVIGDVTIGEDSSIWFGTVVRGDLQPIVIGRNTNIQDNSTVHIMGDSPTIIGDNVVIGHNAIIHCSRVGNNCLIGMGSVLLGYSEIGDNCIIGAGTLITQHKKIPRNSLVYGTPAVIVRALRDDEIAAIRASADHYSEVAKLYMKDLHL